VPLLGQIPLIPQVREGGDAGAPIVVTQPDSPAGEALVRAARLLARESRTLVRKPLGLTVSPKGNGDASPNGHEGHAHDHEQHEHAQHSH
jgi:hypothetical protein